MRERRPSPEKVRYFSYEKPQLQRFGDVAELTRNVGNMGAKDGGTMNTHSTST